MKQADVIPNETAGPSIFWQDEILQVMYWMRGEGFGAQLTIADLRKFLDAPASVIEVNLQRLIHNGLVALEAEQYQLTAMGVREGGRRFADEFEGLLQQGHYECNDPDCDCHDPDNYAPCRATEHHHERPHSH